jgi:hypothetical protein
MHGVSGDRQTVIYVRHSPGACLQKDPNFPLPQLYLSTFSLVVEIAGAEAEVVLGRI